MFIRDQKQPVKEEKTPRLSLPSRRRCPYFWRYQTSGPLTCAVLLVGLVGAIAGAVAPPARQDALSILTLVHGGIT